MKASRILYQYLSQTCYSISVQNEIANNDYERMKIARDLIHKQYCDLLHGRDKKTWRRTNRI
jgi:hypothetical protein